MLECSYQTSLASYFDGQAGPERAREVESHLPNCAPCSAELKRLAQLSELLRTVRPEGIRPDELARVHEAVEGVEDRGVIRMVFGLSAVAASILIISTAWLYDAPQAPSGPVAPVALEQPWERMASLGRPVQTDQGRQTGTAMGTQETIDWMIQGTGGQVGAR